MKEDRFIVVKESIAELSDHRRLVMDINHIARRKSVKARLEYLIFCKNHPYHSPEAIAKAVGISEVTVYKWRKAYLNLGLDRFLLGYRADIDGQGYSKAHDRDDDSLKGKCCRECGIYFDVPVETGGVMFAVCKDCKMWIEKYRGRKLDYPHIVVNA